jgi:Phosphotransferase enzyme family
MHEPREVSIDGTVVTRPAKPWTPTVHALLSHLLERGLPVPEPLALDDSTERVRLVPGDAGQDAWPHQRTTSGVRSAGALLRRVHDATVGWVPPENARWSVPADKGDVICHGDPQPANMTWANGTAVGLFDWDAARPGSRLSDIAYALEWLAPFETDPAELARRGFVGAPDRRARIEAFLDGYGWTEEFDVIETVVRRQRQAIDEVVLLGEAGHHPQSEWVADGWPQRWLSKIDVTRSLRGEL